jgi:hypothetical protein
MQPEADVKVKKGYNIKRSDAETEKLKELQALKC